MEELALAVRGHSLTASLHGSGPTVVALGHGAGGTRRTGQLVRLASALEASGRCAVLFNFPYAEAGRRLPDPAQVLEATVSAVAQLARRRLRPARLVLGGRSMGGRIASQAVAKGLAADGLVFLAYPLHPPGRPAALRDTHLASIRVPMLFVQGTRDRFARADLLADLLGRLGSRARLAPIEHADHSFGVPERVGRGASETERIVCRAVVDWLGERGL